MTKVRQPRTGALTAQLRQVEQLTAVLDPADWQRSLQDLLAVIVATGLGDAAALLFASDEEGLMVRASAGAPGAAVWTPDPGDAAALRALQQKRITWGAEATAFVALHEGAEPIGVLAVRAAAPHSSPLQIAARLASLALVGIRHDRKQAALSNTDGLTGLANHRHFQQAMGVMIAQAYLESDPMAVILLDIDHFKKVNDTYGHLFGDLVLREIGYLLRRCLPETGLAARYGGEEMVVLLKGPEARRAAEVAERIRATIEAHEILDFTAGVKLHVTVSLGVALYELGQGKNKLVARADEALYTSKREGRNRVTVAPPAVRVQP